MMTAAQRIYSAEELAHHAEPPHEHPGAQFIIVEKSDSIDGRILFGRNVQGARTKDSIEYLLPAHWREFFEAI